MATVTKTRTYAAGDVLTAANYNSDRDEIITGVNNVVNAQIDASANIDLSKLASGSLPTDITVDEDNFAAAVTLTGTQTLTNKTLTKPTLQGSVQSLTTDTDGAIVTFDLSASNVHTVTLAGTRTLAVSNVTAGQPFLVRLIQDATGSRTVTWWSGIKWTGGNAPTLTTTAASVDVFGFVCTSTDNYDGYYVSFDLQ